jgi:hypothetical protein
VTVRLPVVLEAGANGNRHGGAQVIPLARKG